MIYPATKNYIDFAVDSIKSGDIIVYPTDTLYGFGVDAKNTHAIEQLNRLKGRVQPLSIIVDNFSKIEQYAEFDSKISLEIKKLFPGKYTVLLNAKENNLSPLVQNTSTKMGIRIPNHFFPLALTKKIDSPIITTSINRHGKEAINEVSQVELDFPNIDIYEDIHHTHSNGSTIIDFTTSTPKVVRIGDGQYPL